MKVEIDQSGKIEDTQHDTVIALANGTTKSIKITASTKRAIQKTFRQFGEPRSYVIHTFTTLIFLLIQDELDEISDVVIDIEYPGFEIVISKLLAKICEKENKNIPDIYFKLVGKNAKCHQVAIQTFQKKLRAGKVLNTSELRQAIFTRNSRNGRPTLKARFP